MATRNLSRTMFCGALASFGLATLMTGVALAQDPQVTLRFSHWSPPPHPMSTISVPEWVNAVEKASNGSIKIQVYPAQQLGKAIDHYDMARDGLVDISWINAGFQPGRFPVAQALEMPWLYKDPQKMTLAFDEWYRPYAEKEMKEVRLCQAQILFPSILHTKKEIKSPADFKGLKVRVANSTQARYLGNLGAVIIPVPATEARDAIEKGVAEAMLFPWHSLVIFGIEKLLTYHMDAPFSGNGFEFIFNKASYDKLSPNQKKVLDAHCNGEWAQKFMATWNKQEADGRAELGGMPGHTVYPVSQQFLSDMQTAVEPVKKEWAETTKKAGYDPDQVWNGLIAGVKKYGAN
jgi:TRAP-type C4-dicarboxylate transport system substrate-binding protein